MGEIGLRARTGTVAALVALVGTSACFGGGGDEDALEPLWQRPYEHLGDYVALSGAWLSDGVLVVHMGNDVSAYDTRTGEPRWTLELPPGVDGVCRLSPDTNDTGIGGILLGQESCSTVGAVDIASGELLWHEDLDPRGQTPLLPKVSVSEGALNVSSLNGMLFASRDLSTGEELSGFGPEAGWRASGAAHDGRYVIAGDDPEVRGPATVYDADTGAPLGAVDLGDVALVDLIASDEPTFTVEVQDVAGSTFYRTYDRGTGGLLGEIEKTEFSSALDVMPAFTFGVQPALARPWVGGGMMIGGEEDRTYHALDLVTGESLWSRDVRDGFPVAMRGERMLALTGHDIRSEDGQRLWAWDPATGESVGELALLEPPEPAPGSGVDRADLKVVASDEERLYAVSQYGEALVAYELPDAP